jgi:serine/threonine-protein kinase
LISETLGRRYKLVRLIGEGGMGSVYEAEDPSAGRKVAVKVIGSKRLAGEKDGVRRFRREAKAAGAISSEHIVRLLDSGEDEATGALYIVMEYLHGEDLQRLIDRVGPLPPDVALRIAAQALTGLAQAHEARIIHRDIKPANVFLSRGEGGVVTVKLLDFGIAKITADPLGAAQATALTSTGNLLGSPLYMSPEQVQSSREVDARTDVWSLGTTIYCALAGSAPHHHITAIGPLLFAICGKPAQPLHERAPWVPAEVADVIHRALAIELEPRYASARDMLEAVQALLPDGAALREDMLVGMGPEAMASIVMRPSMRPAPPPEPLVESTTPDDVVVPPGKAAPRAEALPEAPSPRMPARRAPGSRSWDQAALTVGALLLLGLGAVGIARGLGEGPRPATAATSASMVEPGASAAPPAPPPAPPAAEATRRVSLGIVPANALVEVDGKSAVVAAGAVELAGKLGSVHRVRVFRGNDEVTREVSVTEEGAVPRSVELVASAAAPSAMTKPTAAANPAGKAAPAKPEGAPPAKDMPARPEDVLIPKD